MGDLYAVAALVGFAMMALQTAVIRVGGLAFGASEYVFSTVVAVFVLCIAIGSSVVSLFASRLRPFHVWVVAWLLVALLALLYPALGDSPYWAHRLRVNFSSHLSDVLPYYLSGFGVLLLTLGPAVVCSGALLPMLFHCLRGQAGDLGAVAGRPYGNENAWGPLVLWRVTALPLIVGAGVRVARFSGCLLWLPAFIRPGLVSMVSPPCRGFL